MTTAQDSTVARGSQVVLRQKRLADAPHDYAWRSDLGLVRYDAASPIRMPYAEFLVTYTAELMRPPVARRVVAIDDLHGRHIGNAMYYNIDFGRREAEVGITIGEPAYWGRGYGAEAVGLLVDHIFTETSLTRLYLHTLDWNLRAQRSFARAGFRDCGRARRGGHRFHVMEVRREWRWQRDYARRAVTRSGDN